MLIHLSHDLRFNAKSYDAHHKAGELDYMKTNSWMVGLELQVLSSTPRAQ